MPAEGGEGSAPSDQEVEGHGDEEARQVGAGEGQRGRGGEIEDAAGTQNAEALAQVCLRGGDVLDHGVADFQEWDELARDPDQGFRVTPNSRAERRTGKGRKITKTTLTKANQMITVGAVITQTS